MITLVITDADIDTIAPADRYIVTHPSNGAILAYCDTRGEANDVREAINDLPRLIRSMGHEVK